MKNVNVESKFEVMVKVVQEEIDYIYKTGDDSNIGKCLSIVNDLRDEFASQHGVEEVLRDLDVQLNRDLQNFLQMLADGKIQQEDLA